MALQFEQQLGTAGPIDDPVLMDSATSYLIEQFGEYNSPVMDVRAFNSWFLRMNITAITATDFDCYMVRVRFYTDPSGDAAYRTFVDSFFIFPTQNFTEDGALFYTDQMHGPYMTLDVLDNTIPGRTATLDYGLFGSYRQMPGPYIRIDDSERATGVLCDNKQLCNAATTRTMRIAPAFGPVLLQTRAPAGVTVTGVITYAGIGVTETYTVVGGAAAVIAKQTLIVPKCQMSLAVSHNSGVQQTIEVLAVQQLQPY